MKKVIAMFFGVIILGAVIAYFFSVPAALIVTFVFMVGFILGRIRRQSK